MQPIDRRLNSLQWQFNLLTVLSSFVAIGLAFADLRLLAQLCMIVVTVGLIGSVVVAIMRYNRNKKRHDEIMNQFEKESSTQLEEIFDQARRAKNLPPDALDRTGFRANVEAGQERIERLYGKKRKDGESEDGGKKRGN